MCDCRYHGRADFCHQKSQISYRTSPTPIPDSYFCTFRGAPIRQKPRRGDLLKVTSPQKCRRQRGTAMELGGMGLWERAVTAHTLPPKNHQIANKQRRCHALQPQSLSNVLTASLSAFDGSQPNRWWTRVQVPILGRARWGASPRKRKVHCRSVARGTMMTERSVVGTWLPEPRTLALFSCGVFAVSSAAFCRGSSCT
jgi:hypothetical protein